MAEKREPFLIAVLWVAAALAGGALWALCFEREALVLAPWLALAPLFLLLDRRRATLLVTLHGVAFWAVAMSWIGHTLEVFGGLSGWLAALILLALSGVLALYHLAFGLLGTRLWRSGALGPVWVAALWVALEWLRTYLFTGFPWNLAAYAWVEVPGALELSSLVGPYGVSFLVVLVNAGLARAVSRWRWQPAVAAVAPVALMLAWAARWGGVEAAPGAGSQARIVQPNIEITMKWDPERSRADYERLLRLSREACDAGSALLVWPESATWPFAFEREESLRRDVRALAARGCPVLLNSVTTEGDKSFNSVLLVRGAEETPARADKRHLVPFGEYVPDLLEGLPFVGKMARNVGDFTPGAEAAPLPWGRERLGVSVCYEVIFPDEVAAAVRRGATVLGTVTNDGWYGDSSAPWQHFRAARFRAAENRRPVLRAALTGVSALVEADGSVRSLFGVGEQGVIAGRVRGRSELTFYTRLPWLVPALCSLLAAFAILRSIARRRSP